MELEFLDLLVVDRNAENVRRQQVWRELDAGELGVDRPGQRLGQRGFASAGEILEQHVSAAGHGGKEFPGGLGLPLDHPGNVVLENLEYGARRKLEGRHRGHSPRPPVRLQPETGDPGSRVDVRLGSVFGSAGASPHL